MAFIGCGTRRGTRRKVSERERGVVGERERERERDGTDHVSDGLELVVDDELRNELHESEHVDRLSESRHHEGVPSSVGSAKRDERDKAKRKRVRKGRLLLPLSSPPLSFNA